MNHGSLFSGIGGFDMAAEWMGWNNLFHCEWNEFGQKILKHYWPKAISYGDITKTDFTIHRGTIDVLTGGFPCQPYSLAGKRKGKEDERHLWPEMLRAIREIQPEWVVGENVFGITNWNGGLVFNEVQTDLEAEGYEVQPFVLPACAVNAPHRRDRVWFIAHSESKRSQRHASREKQAQPLNGNISSNGIIADTNINQRCERGMHKTRPETTERHISTRNTRNSSRGTWDNFPTQSPICGRNDGLSSRLVGITVSKHRNESIKAYGNAIVPQVALQIFKAIEQYEQQ